MDYDVWLTKFGVHGAIAVVALVVVLRFCAGKALAWLGEKIEQFCAFLAPHVHEMLRSCAELIHLRVEKVRLELEVLKTERNREEASKT